ncbi:MAG: M24 family metallopeptidase [Novosphingobium sp.]|nr:M24 family metallopeptidase [Novosphingobium sp.]
MRTLCRTDAETSPRAGAGPQPCRGRETAATYGRAVRHSGRRRPPVAARTPAGASCFEDLARASSLGLPSATASRIGHGSGLNLTEPPSIGPSSTETLCPGMIIHVEPKYELDLGVFQTEEVAVVTKDGAKLISKLSQEKLPEIR